MIWNPFAPGTKIRGEVMEVKIRIDIIKILLALVGGNKDQLCVLVERAIEAFLSSDVAIAEFRKRYGHPYFGIGIYPKLDVRRGMGFDRPEVFSKGAGRSQPLEQGASMPPVPQQTGTTAFSTYVWCSWSGNGLPAVSGCGATSATH